MNNHCPICGSEKKKLIAYSEKGRYIRLDREKIVAWDYELNAGERVIEGFCSNTESIDCGVNFTVKI